MKTTGLVLIAAVATVALSGCTGRYYERDYGYADSRYDSAVPGGIYYTDRTPYNGSYYSDNPSREYRDYDGRRFGRY